MTSLQVCTPQPFHSSENADSRVKGNLDLPLVVTPDGPVADFPAWAAERRESIQANLDRYGAILFRGFSVTTPKHFEQFITATSAAPLPYMERSSPRSRVDGNIYTSTDYPPDQPIFLHNEQSYNSHFPMKIYFCCLTASATGGETPIADCRRVYRRLRPETIARFAGGYSYVRNFGIGPGMSWKEAFQTEDKDRVAEYCRAHGIDHEWRGTSLRTRQVRPVVARHPRTGEISWFNHMTFFHLSTLPGLIQEVLRMEYQRDLPNQTYHADGAEITPDVLDELRAAYTAETVTFPWRQGDILMLDNMMVAHGRRPFTGARKVIVGMAEPIGWDAVSPDATLA